MDVSSQDFSERFCDSLRKIIVFKMSKFSGATNFGSNLHSGKIGGKTRFTIYLWENIWCKEFKETFNDNGKQAIVL